MADEEAKKKEKPMTFARKQFCSQRANPHPLLIVQMF